MQALQDRINALWAQLEALMTKLKALTPVETNKEKLYRFAKAALGTDASPYDLASDEYGCADSVNQLFLKAFGRPIAVPGVSTLQLYDVMRSDPRFQEVYEGDFGDIVISPTTYGHNPAMPNGHVGICAKFDGGIMSNDSNTGLWRENFTKTSWHARYADKGGYPIKYFRVR